MSGVKFSPGDKVWAAHDKEVYAIGRIKEKIEKEKAFVIFDEVTYKQWKAKDDQVFPINPPNMDGVADNTQMMFLSDPALLNNLRIRYSRGEIYTYTAYILIAINPYKQLPLYSDENIKKYNGKSIGELPPHVYAISDKAYRTMKGSIKSQSIVVSGESGAGKTETCKFLMRFLAVVASNVDGHSGGIGQLESKVLQSNPILEAFGNAKTLRNNNSSRFGKYTQVHFNRNSQLTGASIITYLLEKSRAVTQAKNERNFHIFYQLLAGSSADEKNKWKLKPLNEYKYLSQSGCTHIEGVDDAKEFAAVKKALTDIGVSADSQDNLYQILSGILGLGNIAFTTQEVKEKANTEERTVISSQDFLTNSAAMFGLTKEELEDKLLHRSITVGGKTPKASPANNNADRYKIPLTPQEATYSRDALSKYIYGTVFDWLVSRINASLPSKDSAAFIGILDISGFEIFENNSFEQVCINFANEKIQQYFNRQILKQEQEIYLLEGLKWRKVEYKDNQDVIDLVEARKNGLLALLDEECIIPKGSDQSFCAKVHTTHASNAYLEAPKPSSQSKKKINKDEGFIVKHFAGEVCYTVAGFLDKNNDTLHDDLLQLLFQSKKPFMKDLFPTIDDDDASTTGNRRFKSVSSKFQQQLANLMDQLNNTTSHFIRCIKPNQLQKPDIFENEGVMTQLRYNGMCTALTLMQAGFPTRCSFEDLYDRYAKYMPPVISNLKPITFCEALLVALDLHGGKDFQMGLTKVFFKAGKLKFLDELTSNSSNMVSNVVSKVKKWLARKRWKAAIFAVISLKRLYKKVIKIRAVRKFRRVGRFMVRMARVWIPLVTKVRKKIMSSEQYKRKQEEELRRKEEDKLVELRKREEEDRQRREKEEAQIRAQEDAKRVIEEQRRREEELRKQVEESLKTAQTKLSTAEETLLQEQKKAQQFHLQVEQLTAKVKQLHEDLAKSQDKTNSLEANLKTESEAKRHLEKQHSELQQQHHAESKRRTELESQVAMEKDSNTSLQKMLQSEREAHKNEVQSLLSSTQSDKSNIESQMERVLSQKADVERQLRDESENARQLKAAKESLEKKLSQSEADAQMQASEHNNAITQLQAKYDDLKSKTDKHIAELDTALHKEKNDRELSVNDLQQQLLAEKTTVASLTKHKASLEDDLQKEKSTNQTISEELRLQKEINASNETQIKSLQDLRDQLSTSLTREIDNSQSLSKLLQEEKKARQEDNDHSRTTLETTKAKAATDIQNMTAALQKSEADKREIVSKLTLELNVANTNINDLKSKLVTAEKREEELNAELNKLRKQLEDANKTIFNMETEKQTLMNNCLNLQVAQQRLKAIFERHPKPVELAKLVFGDLSFNAVVRGCTKCATLSKQGGSNVSKWQSRHVILNDTWLFYYSSPGDKDPKGFLRLDGGEADVSKADLSKAKKQHGFSLKAYNAKKPNKKLTNIFFSAPSEEECDEWVKVISQASAATYYL